MPEPRELSNVELNVVSGGVSYTATLSATSTAIPVAEAFFAIGPGLSVSGGTSSSPGQASTSINVSESNSTPE